MTMAPLPLLGAVEAGGTKFVLAVGHSPTHITARQSIATTTPAETLGQAIDWLCAQGALGALGIASFGPVVLDKASAQWGSITNTPKPGWANCDIAGYFADRLGVPIGFDTDVNGAAMAEHLLGAGRNAASLAYITVGTGIGGGLVIDGKPVHGAAHPEMGHLFPRRDPADRLFAGICPHHGDCLEGLASGPAIQARWGASLSELPQDHDGPAIIAGYLAQLCHALIAISAAEIIVFGGGVAKTAGLLDLVRAQTGKLDAGYFPGQSRHRIVTASLGDNAGVTGAMIMAAQAYAEHHGGQGRAG